MDAAEAAAIFKVYQSCKSFEMKSQIETEQEAGREPGISFAMVEFAGIRARRSSLHPIQMPSEGRILSLPGQPLECAAGGFGLAPRPKSATLTECSTA